MSDLLTPAVFTVRAIEKLRKDNFKGIHNVYSGFNSAARKYFNLEAEWDKDKGINPKGVIAMRNGLVNEGVIETNPTKDGFSLYQFGEKPTNGNSPVDVLAKMGL